MINDDDQAAAAAADDEEIVLAELADDGAVADVLS